MSTSSYLEVTACWILKSPCISPTLLLISDPEWCHAVPDSVSSVLSPLDTPSAFLLPHKSHLLPCALHTLWCHTLIFNLSEQGIWLLPRRKVCISSGYSTSILELPLNSGEPLSYNCYSGFTPVIAVAFCNWNYPLDPICSSKSDTTCFLVL